MLPAFLFITMAVKWGSQSGGGLPPPSAPTPAIYSSWRYSDESDRIGSRLNSTDTGTDDEDMEAVYGFHSMGAPGNGAAQRPLTVTRGGSSASAKPNGILQGGKTVLTRATTFWKSKFGDAVESVKGRFHFQSNEQKKQQELLQQLQTLPVRQVVVPNTTVLPPEVIRKAVTRSGLIGGPLKMDRVQDLARQLKRWYSRQGYILHSVTGASLDPDTATATIAVEEPVVSALPVDIVFCKEMVVDSDTGELLTFKKYREKKMREMEKKSRGFGRFQSGGADWKLDKQDLNTTLITTSGRTKAQKIANALKLNPGRPFQWREPRWSKIASSGVFSKIIKASPEPATDGGVCLQVFAMEPPPRHLEYGIGKSVWTDSWEGEVDFDWRNIFGGGESVGVLVRRGTKDSSPSVRVRYGDDKFGLEGGYDIEAFSDFLGDSGSNEPEKIGTDGDALDDQDSLLSRRGATIRLRNPVSPNIMTNSVASASLERTSTTTGKQENIGSATVTFGPFRRLLPMDAKSSVSTTVSGGTRVTGKADGGDGTAERISFAGTGLLPYSSASATTTQILPLFSGRDSRKRPITLALKHTVSMSTPNLPRHEAKAMGNAAQIRGAAPDDIASSAVKGTTELRLPVAAPRLGSGTVVLFGDWFCVQKDMKHPFYAKSSIGVGLRKSLQGIPLKYDVCYSSEGKVKTMFGIGQDFDI